MYSGEEGDSKMIESFEEERERLVEEEVESEEEEETRETVD